MNGRQACGVEHAIPRLVAVSKFKSAAHVRAAYDAGQRVSESVKAFGNTEKVREKGFW